MSNAFLPNPWQDEANVELLRKLWSDGLTSYEISKRLGVTRNAVIGKVRRMGLQRSPAAQLNERQLAGHGLTRVSRKVKPKPRFIAPKPEPVRKVVGGPPAAAIIRRAEAEPVPLPELREAPVSVLHAKPWTERKSGECTWPISGEGADMLSCCAPALKRGWCRAHFKLGTVPPKRPLDGLARMIARAA